MDENKITLLDNIIGLDIPPLEVTSKLKKTSHDQCKEELMELTSLPLKFYELYDIAFDPSRNRDFEIITVDLLRETTGMDAGLLGGPLRPDGIAYQVTTNHAFGIIIDTKAYSSGYSKNKSQEDEMVRYIEDNQFRDPVRNETKWWETFPSQVIPQSTSFLWVSSKFNGLFEEQLTSTHRRTRSSGGAIAVDQLLIGADKVHRGLLTTAEFAEALAQQTVATF